MLTFVKKLHRHSDELLNLALILSLIRVDPDSYLGFGRTNSRVYRNMSMGETRAEIDFHRSILTDLPDIPHLHPKSVEASLLQYQEELIEDLNNLGRYTSIFSNVNRGTITAYLLDENNGINHNLSAPISTDVAPVNPSTSSSSLASVDPPTPSSTEALDPSATSDISVEDADLIEILWKQDLDLGITRDHFLFPVGDQSIEDLCGKDKLNGNKVGIAKSELEEKNKKKSDQKVDDNIEDDPWAGLSYTVDDETGEHILVEATSSSSEESVDSGCEADNLAAEEQEQDLDEDQVQVQVEVEAEAAAGAQAESSLDKALGFVHFDSDDFDEDKLSESNFTLGAQSAHSSQLIGESDPLLGSIPATPRPSTSSDTVDPLLCDAVDVDVGDFDLPFYFDDRHPLKDRTEPEVEPEVDHVLEVVPDKEDIDVISQQLEDSLEDMIQTAQMHPRSLQVRMPLMRTMSMEHRWQDLANFLSLPDSSNLNPHHPHPHHPHPQHHHPQHQHPHAHHHHSIGSHPHPFAHPYPHGAHPHGSIHNAHAYGVHHHHHYAVGLAPPAAGATPVAAYSNGDAGVAAAAAAARTATSLTEIGPNGSYPSPGHGVGVSIGSAVTASMNLTNTTEVLEPVVQVQAYKTESAAEMQLYYQNNASEVNQTGDGFFPSIFNEDDLQLMDMAITDTMYTPRMLDSQAVSHGMVLPGNSSAAVIASAMDTASDSAVSSMGSERGPSIAEGDWIDNSASDSNATSSAATAVNVTSASAYTMDYSSGAKYRHYDYAYTARQNGLLGAVGGAVSDGLSARGAAAAAPVAQKKHHLFGKRVFHDQSEMPASPAMGSPSHLHKYNTSYNSSAEAAAGGSLYSHPSTPLDNSSMHSMEMKYGCPMDYNHHPHDIRGMEHIHHNHSYAMGSEAGVESQRPVSRDKHRGSSSGVRGNVSDHSVGAGTSGSGSGSGSCSESEAYSRDEKRARGMNIPMTVDDIINLPMDEFNERLSKYDLTEPQLSLIRDIRRRGKNKVAAQNCRKRKLDQILSLADEVKRARERKIRLNKERDFLAAEKARIKDRFAQLYRHVFQSLRDPDGLPYSPYEYSLQQSADGNILLVPRAATASHSAAHHSHTAQPVDPLQLSPRPLLDPIAIAPNVSGIHHGARRKTPDHKNQP